MLITAMVKIKAYNRIYHDNQSHFITLKMFKIVKAVQDDELARIEQSCAEHAIISLVTAFETYYKELVQQLLADYPSYFVRRHTKYSDAVSELVRGDGLFTYEAIDRKLNLRNRCGYYDFFDAFSIPFLAENERQVIEYLYMRRNNYVHNAGRLDLKLQEKLTETPKPLNEDVLSTEAKRMRTRIKKMLGKSYDRVIAHVQR